MSEQGNQQQDNGTLTLQLRKDQVWKYSTFILAAVLIIGAFVFFSGGNSTVTTGNTVDTGGNTAPSQVRAEVDDDAVLGNPDAPVTIIEFSDYQCPFCGSFWSQTLPLIKQQYIDTGKVKLVFRDFPLTSIHPLAQPASEAAECVRDAAGGSDEAYFEYHDKIFGNQASLSVTSLKSWAKDLGYNIDNCLDSGKFRSEVQADLRDATASGGRGTPYFVINGNPLSGAQPFDAFQQIIESELAKA